MHLRFGLLTGLCAAVACGSAPPPPTPTPIAPSQPAEGRAPQAPVAAGAGARAAVAEGSAGEGDGGEGARSPVPVTAQDPIWGSARAPVTIVEFGDFQCPFCSRVTATLSSLKETYGPERLRIVWKNNPLPFHKDARPQAEAAMAVFALGGASKFWSYHDTLFGLQGSQQIDLFAWMPGVRRTDVEDLLETGRPARKVEEDIALGKTIGVSGTPTFFINGLLLNGAQPLARFTAIIDAELEAARQLVASGTPPAQVYAVRSLENYQKPRVIASPPVEDKTVWRIPIGNSPVRGKATALVTMVMFGGYQCPFCVRAEGTVQKLSATYGDKLRVVFKHNPLPMHARAVPAAQLAIEARAQKGDAGFWKVHDLLFAQDRKLEDADLEAVAKGAGLDVKKAMAAVHARKHAAVIDADQELADDTESPGTPHFFINGRRLVGAQPIEKFTAMIDEELARAEELVKKGTPAAKVYDELQKDGRAPNPPKQVAIPAPTKENPSRGPARAKIVVQMFGDFQCPFCKRAMDTIRELEDAYPGQVRIVWRNKPLPFHTNADLAAQAAMEAFKQKGDAGFWKMHDLLYANQTQLLRADLDGYAAQLGLDMTRFAAALDASAHKAAIKADLDVASAAGITGTPTFVVNGYLIPGAEPLLRFKKVIQLSLGKGK